MATAMISSPSIPVATRCTYSIAVVMANSGINFPRHSGHVRPQPCPELVFVTMVPRTYTRYMPIAAAIASGLTAGRQLNVLLICQDRFPCCVLRCRGLGRILLPLCAAYGTRGARVNVLYGDARHHGRVGAAARRGDEHETGMGRHRGRRDEIRLPHRNGAGRATGDRDDSDHRSATDAGRGSALLRAAWRRHQPGQPRDCMLWAA